MCNDFYWPLTLFPSGPGHYGPYYHESVCCYPMVGGRFPKIHDFVPFAICQDLEKLLLTFFTKKFEKLAIKNFQGSSSIRWKMKKIKKYFFEMKLKIWNPYGLRITHTKFESNQRQKFFSVSKGGPFGVFLIFRVSMWRHWLTIMDIKGGIDSLECWNSDVNGCLNNQRNYLETNFWQYHAFIIKFEAKTQYGPLWPGPDG